MTTDYYGGLEAFQPFAQRVPVQTIDPFSDEQVSITVGKSWIAYLVGCVQALNAASSWDTQDASTIQQLRTWAANRTYQLTNWSVPVDLVYRLNATQPINFDYSVDGGTTWITGPNQAEGITPVFAPAISSPSGYELTVNNDQTVGFVPVIENIVDNAVRTDPGTSLVNTVSSATGVTPLELVSGGTVGLLIESQQNAIEIARRVGFDVSLSETFLQITKSVADAGDVLVTVIVP